MVFYFFFFFKQKTAYEISSRDWSSDVCSSDLDEPTGNLDSVNATAIATLLRSLSTAHGKTVIMVSHDPKTVEVFPTVYSMRDGLFVTNETSVTRPPSRPAGSAARSWTSS